MAVMEFGMLEKATLRVVEGDVQPSLLRFLYNPTEFSTVKSASWNRATTASARSTTRPQFAGTQPQTVSMEIFLDAWASFGEDVATSVNTLFTWLKPTPASIARQLPNPPVLAFEWGCSGALADFRGYLKTVTAKYLLFRPDGTPVRATANITLEEVPQEPARQNPTSGAIESQATRTLRDGDSLHSVAWREYDDPSLWRGLAAFNGIDDPLRVPPGTRLLVPSMAEARRLSGGES